MNPEDIPAGLVERAAVAHVNHRRTSAGISPVDRLPWAHSSDVDRAHVRAALAAVWGEIQARTLEEAAVRMVLPGSTATGYYSSEAVSGYREAENNADAWLRAEAERLRGES